MDAQDEFSRNGMRFGIRVSALTARVLAAGMAKLLRHLLTREKAGIVSIKELMKHGDKLMGTEIKNAELEELARVMRRYNIGISVIQHGESKDYSIFFKSKHESQLNAALNDYLAKVFTREHPDKTLPNEPAARQSVVLETYLALPAAPETPLLETRERPLLGTTEPLKLNSPPEYLRLVEGGRPVQPVDMSYSLGRTTDQWPLRPEPRSIPKELREAKLEAQALQQAREMERGVKYMMRDLERGRSR